MTSFAGLSFSNILALLTLVIVLLNNCHGAKSSINQGYNATGTESGSTTVLRPSQERGPMNVTEKTVPSPTNTYTVVVKGGSFETKVRKEEDGGARKEPSNVRRKRSGEEPSDATPVVLKCGVSCTCYVRSKNLYEQYRVICNNTRQEPVILSSAVYEQDDPPTWNKQTYVQVQNVNSVIVTKGFVARWTAYNSCAMDFWDAGDVVLPPGPIEKAENDVLSHDSAGLGIKNSRLAQIPHGVFANMKMYGLDLENVSIPILNLHNLVYPPSNSLWYLRLTNVVVGAIEGRVTDGEGGDSTTDDEGGSEAYGITIAPGGTSSQRKRSGILINNTKIGVIEANGLNLLSEVDVNVSLENSEIGMIKKDGLKLTGRIVPQIQNTRVNLEGEGSIVLDEGMVIKAIHNQIVLPQNIFNQWNCEQNNIEGNDFIVVKIPDSVDEKNDNGTKSDDENFQGARMIKGRKDRNETTPQPLQEQSTTVRDAPIMTPADNSKRPVKKSSQLDAFIHPTCVDHNRILNAPLDFPKEVPDNPSTEPTLEISSPVDGILSNHSLESEIVYDIISSNESQRISIESNSKSEKHIEVQKGLAYLIIAAMGILILIVVVLAGILAFRKKRDSHDVYQEVKARDRRPSLMYMTGSSVYGNDTWPVPSAQTPLN